MPQTYIPTDFPVLSCIEESLEDGFESDTFGLMVEPGHLGSFRFSPGDIFYFSTVREAKPGDDVVVFLYRLVVDHTSRKPMGYYESLLIRKLISANDMEVVLGLTPGMGNENEIIPRNRIKCMHPYIGTKIK